MKKLTNDGLKEVAGQFAHEMSTHHIDDIVGASDGKHVGTYLEHSFKNYLKKYFESKNWGNSAKGIDLPDINTDIKFTSIRQPQSSLPFKDASQKIFGLGYNLIVFVYDKDDDRENNIVFTSVDFIDKSATADYTTTKIIRQTLDVDGNDDDLYAVLSDRNLPGDDITYNNIIKRIRENGVRQGYISISNALQWRASYKRIIKVAGTVEGVDKLYG
ncbi:restriction endonuclease [Limosilactobacillus reuteri]|uniref:restriction endonuclease n=1 Tax=Limosilactobacillus reuteri TaxID=1598 RepID=UPI00128D549C|nr:restriction endonuclease [Limosilactobacillus reuteri]MCC4439729.1 restriction endonuclease [Limosilactobacillus reuteri]MQB71007.1 restriction endonuclease [Limosilactobacillus reuteri]